MTEAISEDLLLGGRIRLRQPLGGLRATIDPILLAAAVPAKTGERVLELGSGTGVASLCLAARVPGCRVLGIEIQAALVALATANAALNDMAGWVEAIQGDILAPPVSLVPASVDHVMANPPFLCVGTGTLPPNPSKAVAIGEGAATLDHWIALAFTMVRPGGTVTFIHRADRLEALLVGFGALGGEIVLQPLWPAAGKPATRLMIRGRRGRRTPLSLDPGLVLHGSNGGYTAAAERILRDCAPFS